MRGPHKTLPPRDSILMKTRRTFLATTAAALSTNRSALPAQEGHPVLSFGLMADCQYADLDPAWGTRFYRESPRKLREAVTELNRHPLAFSFHLGDFIERDFSSFDVLDPIVAQLESKLFHALGNHDFDVKDELKEKVPGKLGLETGYYGFSRDGFRFLIIDTTDVSTYRHPSDNPASLAANEELKSLVTAKVPGSKPWNGRPGEKQIAWLEAELKAATELREKVLVFGHHPILPNESHAVWNAPAMNRLLQKYRCVKLYLNGHNHAGHYLDSEGLHYLTLDGMLETKESNAFAVARLFPDRLEVSGHGRQESHQLKFRI